MSTGLLVGDCATMGLFHRSSAHAFLGIRPGSSKSDALTALIAYAEKHPRAGADKKLQLRLGTIQHAGRAGTTVTAATTFIGYPANITVFFTEDRAVRISLIVNARQVSSMRKALSSFQSELQIQRPWAVLFKEKKIQKKTVYDVSVNGTRKLRALAMIYAGNGFASLNAHMVYPIEHPFASAFWKSAMELIGR